MKNHRRCAVHRPRHPDTLSTNHLSPPDRIQSWAAEGQQGGQRPSSSVGQCSSIGEANLDNRDDELKHNNMHQLTVLSIFFWQNKAKS